MADIASFKTITVETVIRSLELLNLICYPTGGNDDALVLDGTYELLCDDGSRYGDARTVSVTLDKAEAAMLSTIWQRAYDTAVGQEKP